MERNELYHYGIKGMRWGVRRFQNKDGSYTAKGKKRYAGKGEQEHDDYKKAHSSKSVKTMSDAELRSRLNRLQMEQQYSKLSGSDVSRGKAFVSKSMKAATAANARVAEGARAKGMGKALHIAFNGGSVLGLCVVGFGLLGLAAMFLLFIAIYAPP